MWLICGTFILMFLVNPFRKCHFPQRFLVPNSLLLLRHLCVSILTTQFQLHVRSPGLNVSWLLSSLSILLINLQNKQSHERGGHADQQGLWESTQSLIMGIISRYHSSPSRTHLFIETIFWRNQYWQKHVVFKVEHVADFLNWSHGEHSLQVEDVWQVDQRLLDAKSTSTVSWLQLKIHLF